MKNTGHERDRQQQARKARLAEALRANLRRRRMQAKKRSDPASMDENADEALHAAVNSPQSPPKREDEQH